ncbi:hypothetical protein [Undibacterium sp. Ji49W]|uniref:hypothetical protein n=1 Tax=Undibacterium sp. Ji49W TaxID=3413040 RepID=UPI003BF1EB01
MVKNKIQTIGLSLCALATLTGLFFLLPQSHGDEDFVDPQIKLMQQKADDGDLPSISALYQYEKNRGIVALEEYWALQGALLGDTALRQVYIDFFNQFDAQQKQRILEIIREHQDKPGADCLLASLENAKNKLSICEKISS